MTGENKAASPPAREEAPADTRDCKTCAGNGEIVTNWDEYLSPPEGAPADHATADCPDCDGIGKVEAPAEGAGVFNPLFTAVDFADDYNRAKPDAKKGVKDFILDSELRAIHAALASPPVSERERVFMAADDVPVWADGIVTDGESAAIAQKAEADHGGTYWAVDGGDGALDWEPTHFIPLALLTAQPAGEGK